MKILLHDYSGHSFPLELAEEFAHRGIEVVHLFCASIPTTPQAVTAQSKVDGMFSSKALALRKPISKGAFIERFLLERRYGRQLADAIAQERPDVVILCNTPVDALGSAIQAARRMRAACVVWVQDLFGEAALRILPKRLGIIGKGIGHFYRMREERLLASADHLVLITDDFAPVLRRARISEERWTTIPNWASVDKIVPCAKDNAWAHQHGIHDKTVFLYSGTLGFKHNPELLLELARALRQHENAIVVVNSQGEAVEWLRTAVAREGLEPWLQINGFQDFGRISEVLGAADVLLTILEPDAGVFSVPSKVLSNHCAGRAQLLAVPPDNLAAKIVKASGSGLVCDPTDLKGFALAGLSLLHNVEQRLQMGARARAYAEENFMIDHIADRFLDVITTAIRCNVH